MKFKLNVDISNRKGPAKKKKKKKMITVLHVRGETEEKQDLWNKLCYYVLVMSLKPENPLTV